MTKKQALAKGREIVPDLNIAEWLPIHGIGEQPIEVAVLGRNYLTKAGNPSTELLAAGATWGAALDALRERKR